MNEYQKKGPGFGHASGNSINRSPYRDGTPERIDSGGSAPGPSIRSNPSERMRTNCTNRDHADRLERIRSLLPDLWRLREYAAPDGQECPACGGEDRRWCGPSDPGNVSGA